MKPYLASCRECMYVEKSQTQQIGIYGYNCMRFPPTGFVLMQAMPPAQNVAERLLQGGHGGGATPVPGSLFPPVQPQQWCHEFKISDEKESAQLSLIK